MTHRILSCSLLALSLVTLATPAHSGAGAGCIPGVYLVRESSGTQSLWTFSSDGTIHSTSSAQGALGFGDAHGEWTRVRDQQVKSTFLDFTYRPTSVDDGFPPASIARVDAVLSFSRRCDDVHGSFELRFFDPETEDPLAPSTDTGAPIPETFTGRRVTTP